MKLQNKMLAVSGLFAFLILIAAGGFSAQNSGQDIVIQSKSTLKVVIQPGPHFNSTVLLFIKRPATLACWLENEKGEYVDTLFVTHNAKTSEWFSANDGRPGALPVWTAQSASKKADAVSGATLKEGESFDAKDNSELPAGTYIVKFEVNISYDYNETFKENLKKDDPLFNNPNGQPSLVYEGRIQIGGNSNTAQLKLIGAGAPNGQDGSIHNLNGITTAVKIVDSVEVIYQGK